MRVQLLLTVRSRLAAVPSDGNMGYGLQETTDSRAVLGCLLKVVSGLESGE